MRGTPNKHDVALPQLHTGTNTALVLSRGEKALVVRVPCPLFFSTPAIEFPRSGLASGGMRRKWRMGGKSLVEGFEGFGSLVESLWSVVKGDGNLPVAPYGPCWEGSS